MHNASGSLKFGLKRALNCTENLSPYAASMAVRDPDMTFLVLNMVDES